MLDIAECLKYYSRKEVIDELIYNAEDREVIAKFNEIFGRRPDIIKYPQDVITLVKAGATSFHCSEELWKNPLQLSLNIDKHALMQLRTGWDLIIDIDCKIWEISKLVAFLIIRAIKEHGIKDVSCKFSGNKGFHIGIPFESFQIQKNVHGQEIRALFPDGTKKILKYLANYIDRKENDFELTRLIEDKSKEIANTLGVEHEKLFKTVCSECGKRKEDKLKRSEEITCPSCQAPNKINGENILVCEKCGYNIKIPTYNIKDFCRYCKSSLFKGKLDINYIMGIDTILISPRHLFRMPYSLHETTGLCSLPIKPEYVLGFEKEQATPENAKVKIRFLEREKIVLGKAESLITQAYDFAFEPSEDKSSLERNFEIPAKALSTKTFPPCIKLILEGLSDGRKRALFILINFLTSLNWDMESIRKLINEWNKKNMTSLAENYIESQLRHHIYNKKKILPPNCKNLAYYVDIGVCKPDNLCTTIKNPVNYAIKKSKIFMSKNKNF